MMAWAKGDEIQYLCSATDRYLNEPDFACPGNAIQEAVRVFNTDQSLQTLFPDRTISRQLTNHL